MGGYYAFILPTGFFPNYAKHGSTTSEMVNSFAYGFTYEVRIISTSPISGLIVPDNAVILQNEQDMDILVRSTQPGRTVDLLYRTADMLTKPQLHLAFSPNGQKVALSTSLVPTFDPPQDLQVQSNQRPVQPMRDSPE